MTPRNFIHLRTHSAYSLSEGAIQIEDLVALSKEKNMPALGLTDTSNMFGALEFSMKCASYGIQPILGVIINLSDQLQSEKPRKLNKIVLIAKNEEGLSNLFKLVSLSFMKSRHDSLPAISYEDLELYNGGIISLTGGIEGPVGSAILDGKTEEADNQLVKLNNIFRDRLYIELQRHGLDNEKRSEKQFIELAYKYNIPLVATNDVYFASRDMHEAHDVLLCIAEGKYISEENRRKLNPEYYFKSTSEMEELFKDIPEAIQNTVAIAKRCSSMAEPKNPILPSFGDQEIEAETLKDLAYKGLTSRLDKNNITDRTPYFDRLEYELSVITKMNYSGYFLIVSDFIRWAKYNGIPVGPGRGSGAGSVIAWAIEITDLDPLRFGLLFERFLNPDRISMPDFDIDFCQERRDEVIAYVQEKYGKDRVAQIITFGKLQARAVLRDVGRVIQMPYSQVDKICKMIPFNPIDPITLSKAIALDSMLRKTRDEDASVAKLLDIGLRLEGLYRHASTHAAGLVIGDRPLEELLPLYRDPNSNMPVTGYSMKYAEAAGLVKFDFLGLKTLTVIAETCKLADYINISSIALDDKKTYEMLSQGKTAGVFQMESSGMRDAIRKLKPDRIEDIIALISLYRPGPMENIPTYIARKHGREKPDYLHPSLEEILKETFGVMIYQEQVMQIAQVLAGYTLAAADLLRRAMGKKILAEMDAQREQFVEGAKRNGVNKELATEIFELVAKFAGYGFNKSHAAAYALIGYQTAYLKANYPVQFFTASMNLDIGDTDKINMFREEAASMGIKLLPPDINISNAYFSVEDGAIRYGLAAIKGVSQQAMQVLEKERKQRGLFHDVYDIARRLDSKIINKRQIENLAKAGAFDSLNANRHQIFASSHILTRFNSYVQEEKQSAQASLFGDDPGTNLLNPPLEAVSDWEPQKRMEEELDALGFYLNEHPLSAYQDVIKSMGVLEAKELEHKIGSQTKVKLAGVIINATHRAASGRRFTYLQLSDPTGTLEVSIFDDRLISDSRDLIESKKPVLITAEARKDEGGVRLIVESMSLLDEAIKSLKGHVKFYIEKPNPLPIIKDFIHKNPGNMNVSFIVNAMIQDAEKEIEISLRERAGISPLQINELLSIAEVKISM